MNVLVGIPTYDQERYALVPLLQGLQKQTFQNFDIVMVDTSEEDGYYVVLEQALQAAFPKSKTTVMRAKGGDRYERILAGRNAVRKIFLDGKYTHLFFLDSDVLLPRSAMQRLLAVQQKIAVGVYLNTFTGNPEPVLYKDLGDGKTRRYTIQEVLQNETLPIGAAGLGCALITRSVLEKTLFRRDKGTEDVPFFRDIIHNGVQPIAVCGVKCLHMQFPLGDARNRPYDLTKYKLAEKPF